jgi:hypothetical protein
MNAECATVARTDLLKGKLLRVLTQKAACEDEKNYFALAGGTIPFILRYTTICP